MRSLVVQTGAPPDAAELDRLRSALSTLRAERDSLAAERDSVRAERDSLASDNDALLGDHDTLQSRAAEAERKLGAQVERLRAEMLAQAADLARCQDALKHEEALRLRQGQQAQAAAAAAKQVGVLGRSGPEVHGLHHCIARDASRVFFSWRVMIMNLITPIAVGMLV